MFRFSSNFREGSPMVCLSSTTKTSPTKKLTNNPSWKSCFVCKATRERTLTQNVLSSKLHEPFFACILRVGIAVWTQKIRFLLWCRAPDFKKSQKSSIARANPSTQNYSANCAATWNREHILLPQVPSSGRSLWYDHSLQSTRFLQLWTASNSISPCV